MSQEQIQEQLMKAQGYATEIEHILWDIFNCERYGFGGQVNSDKIRRHPFLSITQGLAYLYALHPEKQSQIEEYIEAYSFYSRFSLDDLLSFDTQEKTIDIETIQIEEENGLKQVEKIIKDFRKVIA